MPSWADAVVVQGRWAGCGLAGTLLSGFGHVPRCGAVSGSSWRPGLLGSVVLPHCNLHTAHGE